jgi:hypothetical protein
MRGQSHRLKQLEREPLGLGEETILIGELDDFVARLSICPDPINPASSFRSAGTGTAEKSGLPSTTCQPVPRPHRGTSQWRRIHADGAPRRHSRGGMSRAHQSPRFGWSCSGVVRREVEVYVHRKLCRRRASGGAIPSEWRATIVLVAGLPRPLRQRIAVRNSDHVLQRRSPCRRRL